jgi:hypothetical protein
MNAPPLTYRPDAAAARKPRLHRARGQRVAGVGRRSDQDGDRAHRNRLGRPRGRRQKLGEEGREKQGRLRIQQGDDEAVGEDPAQRHDA